MENLITIFKTNYKKLYIDMVETDHSLHDINPYHVEGSVWAHTKLVYEQTKQFEHMLSNNEFKLIQIASLFHDAGKPYVYVDKNDKRYFAGHWNMSYYLVLDMLNNNVFNLTNDEIKLIALLVLNHHRRYEANNTNIKDKYITKMLSILSYCDDNGRITDQQQMDKFEELIYNESTFKKFDANKPTITFLIGVPNSGKSTYIEEHIKDQKILSRDSIVLELANTDNYNKAFETVNQDKVNNILQKRYNMLIKEHKDFVIDMTNVNKKSRKKFMSKNYNHKAVIFMVGYNEILRRNKNRINKEIPVYVINNFIKKTTINFNEEFELVEYI